MKLYANDYRHVPGIGWYRWDTTRWQIDEDDTILWAAGDLAEAIAAHDPRGLFTAFAQLKTWRFLRRARCSTNRIGRIVAAVHTLLICGYGG